MADRAAFRNAKLIHNPLAGWPRWKRERDLQRAVQILGDAGIEVTLQPTTGPGSATELARKAVTSGQDLVIVCGGDGTINEALQGLVSSAVPLAILPAGTGNVLAKELRLPWSIRRAAALIPQSRVERISVGRAGDRYFLALAGVGPDAATVRSLSQRLKQDLGQLAFWLEGMHQLFVYPFPQFRLEACGSEYDAVFAVISKTRHYGGPIQITRRARLEDDEFEVAVFQPASRLKFLWYVLAVWLRRLERAKDVRFLRARSVRCEPVEPSKRIYVEVDGELAGTLPREFEIVPNALSLVIPPTYRDGTHG